MPEPTPTPSTAPNRKARRAAGERGKRKQAAAEPAPAAASPPAEPRFVVQNFHTRGRRGQSVFACRVIAPDVTRWEVGMALVQAGMTMLEVPDERLPTAAEMHEQARREQLVTQSPAVRLFVRGDEQIWLGQVALDNVGPRLLERGWTNAGAVPKDLRKPCDRASDEAAFDKAYLADAPAE